MRKGFKMHISTIVLAVLIFITFTSCSKNKANVDYEEFTVHEADLAKKTEAMIYDIFEGKFKDTLKNLSETESFILKNQNQIDMISTLPDYVGDIQEIYEVVPTTQQSGITIAVTVRCEKMPIKLTFVYGINDNILSINPSMAEIYEPQTTRTFTEIPIKVGKAPYVLDGLLTQPTSNPVKAVVVLVHPSGPKSMNTTEGGVKPFLDIAHGLAKHGIATIRYNQRFFQYSPNMRYVPSVEEEILEDVSYAIDFAASEESLKGYKIYIAGHSMGGLLAPKIALDNEEVDGLISLAGSPRSLWDIQCDQEIAMINRETNLTQHEKDEMIAEAKIKWKSRKQEKNDDNGLETFASSMNAIDTPTIVKQLDIPMLFLQGTDDFHVYADVDFKQWQTLLEGNDKAAFKLYDGFNHLFFKSQGKTDLSEYDGEHHVEQIVIDDMASWIKSGE